jgi:hypothetical protein
MRQLTSPPRRAPGPAATRPARDTDHARAAITGWQITLIAAPAAALAGRMQAARPRTAITTAHQPQPRCT